MNFLKRLPRGGRFAFAFVLWRLCFLASDLTQRNQPVRSPDAPVLIWDIDSCPAEHEISDFRNLVPPFP
jgi:hypothetical protein